MSSCYPQAMPGININNVNSSGGPGSPACSKCFFGVATRIQHYGVPSISSNKPIAIDNPQSNTSNTLATRVGMEIYNNGPTEVEVSQSQTWVYGDGSARKIPVGAAWFVALGPAKDVSNHYVLAASGSTTTIHVTETGA